MEEGFVFDTATNRTFSFPLTEEEMRCCTSARFDATVLADIDGVTRRAMDWRVMIVVRVRSAIFIVRRGCSVAIGVVYDTICCVMPPRCDCRKGWTVGGRIS